MNSGMRCARACLMLALVWTVACGTRAFAGHRKHSLDSMGHVNLLEIGGRDLRVFSLWDVPEGTPVAADGSFATEIASGRPQKITLKDGQGRVRALALALPGNSQGILFDAVSTAVAMLFQDPGQFVSSAQVQKATAQMAEKRSFRDLVDYLRKRLPGVPLDTLTSDDECIALVEKCNAEIFGQDDQAIRDSLRGAQKVLEKELP